MARQTCRDCGDLLTEENRTMKSVSKKGKQYYLNRCKPCIVEADSILRTLKKQNPQPAAGTPCACCGRIDKLFCDHDHATGKFRAWICRNCNSGIGLLGDSEAGLRQALAYLERVRPYICWNSKMDLSKWHICEVTTSSKGQKTCQLTNKHYSVSFNLGLVHPHLTKTSRVRESL